MNALAARAADGALPNEGDAAAARNVMRGDASVSGTPSALNDLWLHCLLDALAAHGVRRAVLSPGGRSAALVLAARERKSFVDTLVCTDERSGAFAALGMSKMTGEAVLIVTTSGSAVANLAPALTEADACGVPLVVVSCDRPRSLRGTGFGQMTDHIGACQAFVRASVDLDDPLDSPDALMTMRAAIDDALARCRTPRRGPVHINVPMLGRFDSTESPEASAATLAAARVPLAAQTGSADDATALSHVAPLAHLAARLPLMPGLRGMIVAGPECGIPGDVFDAFCARTGFPVIADAASGLRGYGRADVASGFDALAVPSPLMARAPDLVIRFGHAPVMPQVQNYLLAHRVPTLKVSMLPAAADYLHPSFVPLVAPSPALLDALAERLAPGDEKWRMAWRQSSARVRAARGQALAEQEWGELVAAQQIFTHDGFDFVQFGNSMPVRHADLFDDVRPRVRAALSNRGVWGIDGTVGTFIGAARARGDAGLLVLGDLAMLHDLPALASAQRHAGCACICVINNEGGAIFDFLPLAQRPDYRTAVRNPHAIDFGCLAAAFGLRFARVADRESLAAALDAARAHDGVTIVEAAVPAGSACAQMDLMIAGMTASLRGR
ncbi:2-succinyl-5-enolpyruvyl-6-hydroxy-3-cyclohexene-1-carboxylic-acid synthase [Trinickia violacea]|uniref:2-succinyl-5-enolpyruvyl-6-hydroxy-3-cyclohexene-1-carboxylate synthase n=1 Tax=Trinickia violacea TaxID=2571746 RepID=A0A4P8IIU0_9BURK|nr:2-succinyl-5-enolpyruvyl-6-hydroxy-3-cyclohexene-1-carboxylic-acid synthase [Trinickia violacea]QCP48648.1 2-succinyl-5-enolpyruvyl-6-hydroxy-3-cyclohexene-1-carboxylic-acid synthase [Trinickia violacea]